MKEQSTPTNKGRTYPAEILTPSEVGRLFTACSCKAPSGIRNRAMIVVMYRSGLRVSETLDLRVKDIDREMCTLSVLRGKGDKAGGVMFAN